MGKQAESSSDLPKITQLYISQLRPLHTTCHSHLSSYSEL